MNQPFFIGVLMARNIICFSYYTIFFTGSRIRNPTPAAKHQMIMKKYRCEVCDWIYDPEVGDPEGGIAPGVAFEDLPDDWVCPLCGVGKDQFVEEP